MHIYECIYAWSVASTYGRFNACSAHYILYTELISIFLEKNRKTKAVKISEQIYCLVLTFCGVFFWGPDVGNRSPGLRLFSRGMICMYNIVSFWFSKCTHAYKCDEGGSEIRSLPSFKNISSETISLWIRIRLRAENIKLWLF